MNAFWENELVEIAAYYSVAVLCLVIFLTVFELVTSYKNWVEIQKRQSCGGNGDRRENSRYRECLSAQHCPA